MHRKSTIASVIGCVTVLSVGLNAVLIVYCLTLRDELSAFNHAFWNSFDEDDAVAATKARAELVAEALEAYKRDQGSYPMSLDALEPTYMHDVPLPLAGEPRWEYRHNADSFTLTFGISYDGGYYYPSYTYNGATSDWDADF